MRIKEGSFINLAYGHWKIFHFYHGNSRVKTTNETSMWYWLFVAAHRGEI